MCRAVRGIHVQDLKTCYCVSNMFTCTLRLVCITFTHVPYARAWLCVTRLLVLYTEFACHIHVRLMPVTPSLTWADSIHAHIILDVACAYASCPCLPVRYMRTRALFLCQSSQDSCTCPLCFRIPQDVTCAYTPFSQGKLFILYPCFNTRYLAPLLSTN